ncbi:MAG: zinc transporter ZntB [Gammaproteobacteria bacterium]|nr:zinc transporter ZntB [Gammaproteobacteria bacterium]
MSTAAPPTDRGLVWAYLLDRRGGGSRVGWETLATWQPAQGLLWAHFDISEPGPETWLEERSGMEPQIAAALLAEDTRPRSASSRNGLLVILRGVNLNPGAEPDDMVSVRVWLERDRIITTRRRQLQANGAIRQTLDEGEGPSSAGEFLCALVEHLVDRIGEAVDELDANIDAVEETTDAGDVMALRSQLTDLRRQTAHMRRFLAPQRDALERLVRQPDPILAEQDNLSLREQADRVQRFLEDLDLIRERGLVSQEEILSRVAYQQGRRIFVLSVVSCIFLPLTFLTGLMGMNVGGIPGANTVIGFSAVSGLFVALGAGLAYWFRRRNWL